MVITFMRILKRKKGNEQFFYLQHSFRENGKVITKEKYLGKEIPENIEQIKSEIKQQENQILYQKLDLIKQSFQKYWNSLPEIAKQKELEQIAIAFTYNTNAIEGSTITLFETMELIQHQIAPHKSLNDVKETEKHAKVFFQMLKEKQNFNKTALLQWHQQIFEETKAEIAGKYRDFHVRVGMYRAPDWQDVEQLMQQFFGFVKNNKNKMHAIEFAAKIHYQFEKIHPFGDGNGRIGRLIINNILWQNGFPMIIIEVKKRKQYYYALEKDENSFVQYFTRLYLAAHKKRYIE